MKIKWKNVYLTIWNFMSYGCVLLISIKSIFWYLEEDVLCNNINVLMLIHIIFSLSLYVTTEMFESISKKRLK